MRNLWLFRSALVLVASMMLTACSPDAVPRRADIAGPVTPSPASCAAGGGTIQRRGMAGSAMCVVRFADAGKACSGKADCRGLCVSTAGYADVGSAAAGQCQAENTPFGCYAKVEGGRIATPFLCTD